MQALEHQSGSADNCSQMHLLLLGMVNPADLLMVVLMLGCQPTGYLDFASRWAPQDQFPLQSAKQWPTFKLH